MANIQRLACLDRSGADGDTAKAMAENHTATFDNIPAEKRERILRAAALVLGRDGIGGARMADVAKEAGVSHGSIFSYFPTKDDMVRAVVDWGADAQSALFAAADTGAQATDAIRNILRGAWDFATGEPELISLWMSLSLIENERFASAILPLERAAAERWLAIVERGKAEGSIGVAVDSKVAAYLIDALAAQLMKSRASELERAKIAMLLGDANDAGAPEIVARFACGLLRLRP